MAVSEKAVIESSEGAKTVVDVDTSTLEKQATIPIAPGTTISLGSTSYFKTYQYYSGSVYSRLEFQAKGYQESFDWQSNRFNYYIEKSTFDIVGTYEQVGTYTENELTVTGYENNAWWGPDLGRTPVTEIISEEVPRYDWVESEIGPTVEVRSSDKGLYTYPHSVGIIAEVNGEYALDDTEGSPDENKSHEMAFTDNLELEYNLIEDDPEPQLIITLDRDESNLISHIFSWDNSAAVELDNSTRSLIRQIFDSSFVARNIFKNTKTKNISTNDLGDLAGIETQFSASVSAPTITMGYSS